MPYITVQRSFRVLLRCREDVGGEALHHVSKGRICRVDGYAKCKCATVSAYRPRDTPKCDSSSTLASALQLMDAHHSIGNSHVLFMIWGSSQVSFPVMLYPFSMMCQQYNQGPVPRQMSWVFCIIDGAYFSVEKYTSTEVLSSPVQLRSRSTSFPCFNITSPTTVTLSVGINVLRVSVTIFIGPESDHWLPLSLAH